MGSNLAVDIGRLRVAVEDAGAIGAKIESSPSRRALAGRMSRIRVDEAIRTPIGLASAHTTASSLALFALKGAHPLNGGRALKIQVDPRALGVILHARLRGEPHGGICGAEQIVIPALHDFEKEAVFEGLSVDLEELALPDPVVEGGCGGERMSNQPSARPDRRADRPFRLTGDTRGRRTGDRAQMPLSPDPGRRSGFAAPARDALEGVRTLTFSGVNATYPYKVAVVPLLDELDPSAAKVGAVNTVAVRGERLIGFDTECSGFRRGVRRVVGDVAGQTVALLGAGGVGKAIGVAPAESGIGRLRIVDRDAPRAVELADALKDHRDARACATAEEERAKLGLPTA